MSGSPGVEVARRLCRGPPGWGSQGGCVRAACTGPESGQGSENMGKCLPQPPGPQREPREVKGEPGMEPRRPLAQRLGRGGLVLLPHGPSPATTTQVCARGGVAHTCHQRRSGAPFVSLPNLPGGIRGSDGPVSAHSPPIAPTISPALRNNGP